MLALQFEKELRAVDVPVPTPREGEALIRLRLAGICNTDLEIVRGYSNFRGILGHEFVGEVVEASDGAELIGARVVGEINLACGECSYCRRGWERHCPKRTVLGILGKDGCFAEYFTLPVRNLHRVPEALPDRTAVFTEPLAACVEILEQVSVPPSQPVCVVGDGKLALLLVQVLKLVGAEVYIVGKHPEKLAIAQELGAIPLGAETAFEPRFDFVVEASGSPSGLELALRIIRPRGTLVLKSTYAECPRVDTSQLVVDELCVLGSRCGPFEPALRLLADGLVQTEPLVSAVFPLSRGIEAFREAEKPGILKVLLSPE